MRVFRDTYPDRVTGKRREARSWTIEYRDQEERPRRIVAFADRKASEELGRRIQRLAEFRSNGDGPDRELARAIESWPERIRKRLAETGLLDPSRAAAALPLSDHFASFKRSLLDRGNTEKHATQTAGRASRARWTRSPRAWPSSRPDIRPRRD